MNEDTDLREGTDLSVQRTLKNQHHTYLQSLIGPCGGSELK